MERSADEGICIYSPHSAGYVTYPSESSLVRGEWEQVDGEMERDNSSLGESGGILGGYDHNSVWNGGLMMMWIDA